MEKSIFATTVGIVPLVVSWNKDKINKFPEGRILLVQTNGEHIKVGLAIVEIRAVHKTGTDVATKIRGNRLAKLTKLGLVM
jgi:hypothetical protein